MLPVWNQYSRPLATKPLPEKCDAMEGLLKEGDGIIEYTDDGTITRDAGVISAAQKIEILRRWL
jgi:ferritin-like metal-binding protein YciE